MEKQIYVVAREKETKSEENKHKFVVFSCRKANGDWATLKFTADCVNKPTCVGGYDIIVDSKDMSVSHDTYGEVWWCKKVARVVEHIYEDIAENEF